MPAGESFTPSELNRIRRAIHNAETMSGLTFSVFIGVSEEDSRAYAARLHSALSDPNRTVFILCDPGFRALEIITGAQVARTLSDTNCALASAAMQVSFSAGDVVGGLVTGIQQLGEAARAPKTLHGK